MDPAITVWCLAAVLSISAAQSPLSPIPYFTTEAAVAEATGQHGQVGCGQPAVQHGQATEEKKNFTVGEAVMVRCDNGYRVPYTKSNVLHLVCGTDGSWQDLLGFESAHCERIGGCPTPRIAHSIVSIHSQGYMPGDMIQVVCQNGYQSQDEPELIRCMYDGTWMSIFRHNITVACIPKVCPYPLEINDGKMLVVVHNAIHPRDSDYNPIAVPEGSNVTYTCNAGFQMYDPSKARQICKGTAWSSSMPSCIKKSITGCPSPGPIKHASHKVYTYEGLWTSNSGFPENSWLKYTCDKGYVMSKPQDVMPVCYEQRWQGPFPQCMPEVMKECAQPPDIHKGSYMTTGHVRGPEKYTEGVKVYYYCENGYRLQNANTSHSLQCRDSEWLGVVPSCGLRTHCDSPMDIRNGNWVFGGPMFLRPDFGIGTRISYECRHGYKAMGTTEIVCLSSGYWSDYAPRCLAENEYCSEPGPLENGVYMCEPSHCDLFKVGTKVHYVCNKDYEPREEDILEQDCLPGGRWTAEIPVCQFVKVKITTGRMVSFSTSTLTVVIATSCGVLGLLVVVMVVVALQRRRKHHLHSNRLCHSSPAAPPPYQSTPPTGLVDDPDRVALIAFADGVQVVLPSYEEALRSRGGSRLSRYTSDSTRGSIRSSSSRDYRPLPSLPPNLRGGGPQIREIPPDHHRDHHRNSIITTTSITTRDNLSLALGSMDTMNISDGTSTTVTVDTASSNPSIATSQRATAGSIESSSTNGSLATEDAPLLDQNHYNTETIRSHHSNTSDSHHGNLGRCPCNDRIGGYDTLHSQTSRSQSESSPIAEVPEEQKES